MLRLMFALTKEDADCNGKIAVAFPKEGLIANNQIINTEHGMPQGPCPPLSFKTMLLEAKQDGDKSILVYGNSLYNNVFLIFDQISLQPLSTILSLEGKNLRY